MREVGASGKHQRGETPAAFHRHRIGRTGRFENLKQLFLRLALFPVHLGPEDDQQVIDRIAIALGCGVLFCKLKPFGVVVGRGHDGEHQDGSADDERGEDGAKDRLGGRAPRFDRLLAERIGGAVTGLVPAE